MESKLIFLCLTFGFLKINLFANQERLSERAADRTEAEMTAQQKIEEEVFKQIFIPRQLDQVRQVAITDRLSMFEQILLFGLFKHLRSRL